MIKDNQKTINRGQVALDGIVTILSYALSWYLIIEKQFLSQWVQAVEGNVLPPGIYFFPLVFIVPLYLLLYDIFHLYTPKRVQGRRRELANICKANLIGLMCFTMILYLGGKNAYFYHFSRRMVIAFCLINIVLETLERNLVRMALHSMRARGLNQKHILLIGYSRAAEGFIDRILANAEWGYRIRGILDNQRRPGYKYKSVEVIGRIGDLDSILNENSLDEIAITLGLEEYEILEQIVASCEKSGVHTKFIPDYNNIIPTIPYIEDLQGLPVVNIRHVPLTNLLNAAAKRLVDVLGAIAALIIFSPVMLLAAGLIKLTSPGPVIFSQERVGLHNRPFKMYKFRSMEVQSPAAEKAKWTTPKDPRVTPVGKFIRKTSIDEMPQFFNILRGDMSLVGPRPERPFFVERFKEEIPRYMIKHQVRPGLTGWAQVNGYRGDTSITKRIEHDLYYIENWSMGFDAKILFLTIFKGFINKNAY